jgi:hypothetical protein
MKVTSNESTNLVEPIKNALPTAKLEQSISKLLPVYDTTKRTSKAPTKIKRVLIGLCERSYNRFDAARSLSDWCLHSTASTIQSKGIIVQRVFETVPGFDGNPTSVCRYWIAEDQHDKVRKYLGLS